METWIPPYFAIWELHHGIRPTLNSFAKSSEAWKEPLWVWGGFAFYWCLESLRSLFTDDEAGEPLERVSEEFGGLCLPIWRIQNERRRLVAVYLIDKNQSSGDEEEKVNWVEGRGKSGERWNGKVEVRRGDRKSFVFLLFGLVCHACAFLPECVISFSFVLFVFLFLHFWFIMRRRIISGGGFRSRSWGKIWTNWDTR